MKSCVSLGRVWSETTSGRRLAAGIYHFICSCDSGFLAEQYACGFLGAMVTGHVESSESTGVLGIDDSPTFDESGT